MKRLIATLLALMLLTPVMALAEEDNVVNILSWVGYIDDDTLFNFEEATGVKVVWSPMESIDEMLLKVTQGNDRYDLILTSDYSIDILRQGGYLQKLDLSKLENYENLDERYLSQTFDPQNEYSIPYVAGSPLIVYDPAKVPFEITGYNDLWDERLKGQVAVLDSARVIGGITLKSMGESMNETDADKLAAMKDKLMKLYPNIGVFGDFNAYTAIVSGEASVMFNFTPFCFMATLDRPDLKVVYPTEGLGYGIDGFVIPANAEHADKAHKLLDYLMQPDIAANNAQYQGYMCVNKEATGYLSSQYTENKVVNVPEELLTDSEFIINVGDTEVQFQEIYTAFKNQ